MSDRQHLLVTPAGYATNTDLYQLTMMAAYFEAGMAESPATFELFVRSLPKNRGFLVAAGLEQALDYLDGLHFSPEAISYLREQRAFSTVSDAFFDYLEGYRFDCEVYAVREGTILFPQEPFVQVRGPLASAQLVETFLLSVINYQTLVASKAARIWLASEGRVAVDFGTRRAHGPQAGLYAARASYIGGMSGTSNVEAGRLLGVPIVGTAAHSYIMSFASEREAFEHYHRVFPDATVLLVDTYDTLEGTRIATEIGKDLKGIRLDSGDLAELSKGAREILDRAGLTGTLIVASGDLNEDKITRLIEQDAKIDMFGVGTEMVTSKDAPALSGVYKLVERYEDDRFEPVMKLSQNKMSYPGRKQVYRTYDGGGVAREDVLWTLDGEPPRGESGMHVEPLLVPVFADGRVVAEREPLDDIRQRCLKNIGDLPDEVKQLHAFATYPVGVGAPIEELIERFNKIHES